MDGHSEHATLRHVQDINLVETGFTLARGFRGGLGLELTTFFRRVGTTIEFEDLDGRPIIVPGGDIHHRNEALTGPGDPWLMAVAGRRRGPWSAAVRGGVTIPLGRTEDNPFALGRIGLSHQHIQFGTGTWDPLAGASVGRRFGEIVATAGLIARMPVATNDHGYRAGRRIQGGLGADRRLTGPWRVQAGLDYGRETAETWNGVVEEEGNLGRSDLLLSTGLARAIGSRALVLSLKVPLRTRSNGVQVDYPAIVTLGWQ